jgi:DNA-binding SARP family transcriptional activator
MEFSILGPLEVRDRGRVVSCPSAKQRLLLAVLLLRANEVVSTDALTEALWGERPPPSARKALQMHVSQLRALLEPERPGGGRPSLLVTRPPGYQLTVEPGRLDVHRFEAGVRDARAARQAGRWGDVADGLAAALALWRGDPLADLAVEEVLQPEVARLEELRIAAIEDRVEADLALGGHADLLPELEGIVARHPLRERPRAQLMLALYRAGRQADALEVYAQTRRMLVDELGLEPSRELQELQQLILTQDAGLEAAPDEGLVGRERELSALEGMLDRALAGRGGLALLAGDAGIGKSRLAEAIADRARQRGALVLVGRCWESGGAPGYWPWVQVLRASLRHLEGDELQAALGAGAADLATILPELRDRLGDLPEAAVERPDARFLLFEAVSAHLMGSARRRPVVVVLDDLHAADAPSILLLRYLIAQLAGARLLVVGCHREAEAGTELAAGLAEAARDPAVLRLVLPGLDPAATERLLAQTMLEPAAPDLVARVHAQTEGNALYVAEIGRLLAAGGHHDRGELPVPAGVHEAIRWRLQRRSEPCRTVLGRASVIGREFESEVLRAASGIGEPELAAALDEATTAGLLEEVAGTLGRLRFSHVLVRDVLYGEQPAAARAGIHRGVGEALEVVHATNLAPHLAELAHHYGQAGSGSLEKATDYSTAAGDRASGQLAFEEAARHYAAALSLLEGMGAAGAERSCDLQILLGEALARAGDDVGAKAAFARAAELGVAGRWPDRLARAAVGYGGRFAWARAATDPALVPLLEQALLAIGKRDSPERVQLLARLAAALRDDPARDRRVGIAAEAVAMARRLGDPAVLARAIEGAQPALETPGDPAQRFAAADELLALGGQIGDRESLYLGHDLRLHASWATCDRDGVDAELAALAELAQELRQPAHLWSASAASAGLALMEGRLVEAGGLIEHARELGERAQSWNAGVSHTLATFVLRRAQGRLGEIVGFCARAVDRYPAQWRFRCALADVHARLGRRDDARRLLDRLLSGDLAHDYVDAEWLFSMAVLAEASAEAADADGAQYIYDVLLPFDGFYAEAPIEAPFGSVARALGILAVATGRVDDGVRHLTDAIATEERMGAPGWQAHAQQDLAALLVDHDPARAMSLLADAGATYRRLGMEPWACSVEELATRAPDKLSPAAAGRGGSRARSRP